MADLATISDNFLAFEKDNNLLEKTIDDIFFWALIRDRVFDNIMIEKGLTEPRSHTVSKSLFGKIRSFTKYSFNAFINVLKPYKQADTLIVNHPRKVKLDGAYVDIYSQWLVDKLKKDNESYLVLDFPRNWSEHLIKKDKNTRNLENFTIIKKVYYKFFAKSKLRDNEVLQDISKKLKDNFGSDGNVINLCYQQMNIYRAEYSYYIKLLKKIKPKKIFYVVINSQRALISAAKTLGIEIEEIQHGFMGRYHLGYSYPYNSAVPYFPDRFCFFGKYWADITPMPLSEDKYDYYENIIRRQRPGERAANPNNKIVVLSQSNIGSDLNEFINEVLQTQESKDYEFIIKLHPTDFHVWRDIYPLLTHMQEKYDNVRVVDSFDIPLHELLKDADTVVGVTSTALFEALYFGCGVCIVDMAEAARIKYMMSEDIAHYISKPQDLFDAINNSKNDNIDIDYIFYKNK